MPNPTYTSFLGIAKETTKRTAQAAVDFLPVKTMTPLDHQVYLPDTGMRGSQVMNYGQIAGVTWAEYDFAGDVFPDTFGYPLAGVLGDVTTTAGTAAGASGTLAAASVVGATTVSSSVSYPAGTLVQIDVGALAEVVTTNAAPVGTGPFTIGVPALVRAHASGVAIAAVGTANTHAIAVRNTGDGQPPSYTFSDYNAMTTRQFAGAQFSDVGILFTAEGMLNYTAKAKALASVPGAQPPKSYTSVPPLAVWRGAITVAGAADLTILDGTCDIKRNIDAIHTIDGTAPVYNLWAGAVAVSGKLAVIAETEAHLLNYLNNLQPSLDISFQQGVGAQQNGLQLHMSKAAYLTGQINRGKDYIQVDVTYEAVANTSDVGASAGYSPIKATITSAKAAGTYA